LIAFDRGHGSVAGLRCLGCSPLVARRCRRTLIDGARRLARGGAATS
jgi:hypothetical protein